MKSFFSAIGAAVVAGAIFWSAPTLSDFQLSTFEGITPSSRNIYSLHIQILLVCLVITAGVYGAMIVAIVRFRKSAAAKLSRFTSNATVEILWTIIPYAILIGMAVPAALALVRLEDLREIELTLEVTGYQSQISDDSRMS